MNLLNILHSIEGTVFEIATWVIYLPKTFFQTFRHPRWIQGYVMQEWDFDADKRFQTYMTPVLYWLIAGVLASRRFVPSVDELGSDPRTSGLSYIFLRFSKKKYCHPVY